MHARQLLAEKNWNLQAANEAFVRSQAITIQLINKANWQVFVTQGFNRENPGMEIIYFL